MLQVINNILPDAANSTVSNVCPMSVSQYSVGQFAFKRQFLTTTSSRTTASFDLYRITVLETTPRLVYDTPDILNGWVLNWLISASSQKAKVGLGSA